MAIILTAVFVEGPCAAAEMTDPVVRWASISLGVAEQVVVAFGRCGVRDRRLEPPMLRRCVIGHDVKDDLHVELVCPLDHGIDISKGAVLWVDVAVERHVVAMIMSGRRVERRDPDDVDPEPLQIIEAPGDACDITDAITIAVGEGPDINLVTNSSVEPLFGSRVTVGTRQDDVAHILPTLPVSNELI